MNEKPDTVREIFRIFLKKVQELRDRELLQKSFKTSWKLSVSLEKNEAALITDNPNEELLRSLWITIRYFFLKNEVGYIFHIYNLCQIYLTNEEHKKFLIKSREILLSKINSSSVMDLSINCVKYSPLTIFNTFTNAIFHSDIKCIEFLDSLDEFMKSMLKREFIDFIMSSTDAIFYLAKIVNHALENNEIKTIPGEIL